MSRRLHTRWPHDASRQSHQRNQEALQEGAQGRPQPLYSAEYAHRRRTVYLNTVVGVRGPRLLKPSSKFRFAVGDRYDGAEWFEDMCNWAFQRAFDDVVGCFCLSAYVAVLYVIRRRSARRSEVGQIRRTVCGTRYSRTRMKMRRQISAMGRHEI